MRQISLRQEAGRLGGIGVCGRELCCSTWIHDFKSVSTSAARYQNLSLNPTKLSGQCGRLKCCLNYELDTYMTALEDIPTIEKPLVTEAGHAKLQKTDIFRKLMWFSYNNENNWHSIDCDRVKEIIEMNKEGKKPFSLELNDVMDLEEEKSNSNIDLELLDKKFSKNNKKRKKRKPRQKQPSNRSAAGAKTNTPPPNKDQKDRQQHTRRKPSNRRKGGEQRKGQSPPKQQPSTDQNNPQASQGAKPKGNKRRNNRRKGGGRPSNNKGNQQNDQ